MSMLLCTCLGKEMKLQEKEFNFPAQTGITLLSCSSSPCYVVVAETFPLNLLTVEKGVCVISDIQRDCPVYLPLSLLNLLNSQTEYYECQCHVCMCMCTGLCLSSFQINFFLNQCHCMVSLLLICC